MKTDFGTFWIPEPRLLAEIVFFGWKSITQARSEISFWTNSTILPYDWGTKLCGNRKFLHQRFCEETFWFVSGSFFPDEWQSWSADLQSCTQMEKHLPVKERIKERKTCPFSSKTQMGKWMTKLTADVVWKKTATSTLGLQGSFACCVHQ